MKFLREAYKLAVSDFANQYAVPVKSLVGSMVSRSSTKHTLPLVSACIDKINPEPDDNILELGYGRGRGLSICAERLQNGSGMVFGIDRSQYMEDFVRKKYILEIEEQEKIRLDRAPDLRNLPYPSDLFRGIFHVDFFYFIHDDILGDVCNELRRIVRPGGLIVSAMQFSRLRKLQKWGMVTETQTDPLRYLTRLEPAGFVDVTTEYITESPVGEFQLISARRPDVSEEYFDPEERMRELEMQIKRELVVSKLIQGGQKPTLEDMQLLKEVEGKGRY